MKIRFIRYEEAPKYFGMDSELIIAYAKAAGAVYQLARLAYGSAEIRGIEKKCERTIILSALNRIWCR